MATLIGALATPPSLVDRQLKGTPTLSALVCKPVQSLWFELGTQSVVVANPLRPSLSSDTPVLIILNNSFLQTLITMKIAIGFTAISVT